MPIPDHQTLMLPFLRLPSDGAERRFRDAVEALAVEFRISPEERSELLPSGTAPLFDNRVGWARTFLKQAGLIESPIERRLPNYRPRSGSLARNVPLIDNELLDQYPEIRAFRLRRRDGAAAQVTERIDVPTASEDTPEDALAEAYGKLRRSLERDLIDQVRTASPAFFERLVIDLVVSMGYGGSRADAGKAAGLSGDGGIDGIIKEDKLGLDVIYVQAKRWEGTAGRPEIQKFARALQGQRASKGSS